MARFFFCAAAISAGRCRLLPRQPQRQMSKVTPLPDALSLYRDLLRTVRAFPAEPMLDLNGSGTEQCFAVAASVQIRHDFKINANADPVAAGKLIAAGKKELKALHALLGNEHLKRYPGPPPSVTALALS